MILICFLAAAGAGLLTRPSYLLVGQLNWMDVLTKGYYVGSISRFFTQSMIDESFFWVLKFGAAGIVLGLVLTMISSDSKSAGKTKKKKA